MVVFGVGLFALAGNSLSTGSPGIASELQVRQGEVSSSDGLLFVENAGQWPEAAGFQVWGSPASAGTTGWRRMRFGSWWQVASCRLYEVPERSFVEFATPAIVLTLQPATLTALKLSFPGANPDVRIVPLNPLTTTVSYFMGNDPTQWRPDVPVYGGVRYADLYPGVHLVLGQTDSFWRLEAEPGAATSQIRLQVEGAAVENVEDGMLRLAVDGGSCPLACRRRPSPTGHQAFSRVASCLMQLCVHSSSSPTNPVRPATARKITCTAPSWAAATATTPTTSPSTAPGTQP